MFRDSAANGSMHRQLTRLLLGAALLAVPTLAMAQTGAYGTTATGQTSTGTTQPANTAPSGSNTNTDRDAGAGAGAGAGSGQGSATSGNAKSEETVHYISVERVRGARPAPPSVIYCPRLFYRMATPFLPVPIQMLCCDWGMVQPSIWAITPNSQSLWMSSSRRWQNGPSCWCEAGCGRWYGGMAAAAPLR